SFWKMPKLHQFYFSSLLLPSKGQIGLGHFKASLSLRSDPYVELPPLKLLHSFCALKPDNGPCRAMIKQFFFNIHTQQCEEFMYGGCEGNQNRFATLEDCQEKCIEGRCAVSAQSGAPDYCFLDEDSGLCRGYITRYFYNNETKKCEEFKYGGCLGNQNNFMTLEQCKSTCEDLGNMTPLDLTNNVTPVDSVNNDSVAPQPTEAPSFLGKNSFFLKFLSPKYYGNNRSRMYIRSLLLFLFL
uniref:Tissue factor pathway inhibitor n=1 Tax=Neovison vison TaxID=452646 RepID=A0A8C7A5D4_NEOVI